MKIEMINRILEQTAYVRTGGTEEELKTAEYLRNEANNLGAKAELESFPVPMAKIHKASLNVDGKEIACKGYFNAGSGSVSAPFYYLRGTDAYSLSQCKEKIVMIDGYLGYWRYQDLLENGAVGVITYDGNANYADHDIDQRELRSFVHKGNRVLCVNINAKSAIDLVNRGAESATITIEQDEWEGESHNVIAELAGTSDEWIALTAHYDSTSLSEGAYDNMSGSIGLLGILEHFAKREHHYGLRFIWCGSEERGLLGSKAYCEAHPDALEKTVLNINLDMIGCIMGKFIYCASAEERLCHYIEYLGDEMGFGITGKQDVYSSDSTPFADKGVPAVSFARIAPTNTATIHNRYDTRAVMKAEQLQQDVDWLNVFTDRMTNAKRCPVKKEIPEKVRGKLDEYLCRKRPDNT